MRHLSVLKILAIIISLYFVASAAPAEVNKQFIELTLRSGETVRLEYRSFIEKNFSILPEKAPDTLAEEKDFGEQRLIFVDKDTCEQHNIGIDNLKELEFIGITENPCSKQKDWLFKLNLLDLDKYEGFFQRVETNTGKALVDYGMKGQLMNQTEFASFRFEDIEKITFFPM